jgi:glycosyltransferase involved in cell wall biosynthesis
MDRFDSYARRLAKFRHSPERFFADSRHVSLQAIGKVVAPPIMRSEWALAVLENPLDALVRSSTPVLHELATRIAERRAAARRRLLVAHGNPEVSVIMAALNAATTISEAIASLVSQSYASLEVIVVDDGSDDETRDIVRAKMCDEPRLTLIEGGPREGAAAARNRGLRASRGAFLTFQDADDVSHPERIERQLAAVIANDARVAVCNSLRETADGRRVIVNGRRFAKNYVSMLFPRKPVFNRIGYMRKLIVGEDAEYHERLRAVFGDEREVHLFQTLYRQRFAPDSLLFSHSDTRIGTSGEVSHELTDEVRIPLDAALDEIEAIRRGERDPYVAFEHD